MLVRSARVLRPMAVIVFVLPVMMVMGVIVIVSVVVVMAMPARARECARGRDGHPRVEGGAAADAGGADLR